MSLFGMAREPKNKAKDTEAASSANGETARPGTSGTEMFLTSNRLEASKQFEKAQKAEQTYRAKKRATAARTGFQSAKRHFKESGRHLKAAITMTFASIKSLPYMLSDRKEERRRARQAAKRKKLEEHLARQSADDAATAAAGKGADEDEKS